MAATISYENGHKYEGEIHDNNIRHGYGIMKMSNGDTYKGEYLNDKRNGYGKYVYRGAEDGEEEFYDGHFVNNKRDGFGVYTYITKTTYTGWWRENLKEGSGVLVYPDGIVIKGTFYNGTIKFGEIQFPSGGTCYHSHTFSIFLKDI